MSGWVLGWMIGGTVVVVVVALLLLMIRGAAAAAGRAEAVLVALDKAKVNTSPLWAVDATNQVAGRIVAAAAAARAHLAGPGGA